MSTIEQQIPTGTWTVDKAHSSVGFTVKHSGVATFRGAFTDYDARLVTTGDAPRLEGTVRAASVDVRDENIEAHLASPEFFDIERTPEISFVARDLRVGDDGALALDGELTLRGQTREVEAKGELSGPNDGMDGLPHLGLSLAATIDRTAFGLKWNAPLPKGGVVLANDVKLLVELELVKQD